MYELSEEESIKFRIYSYCYSGYQVKNFKEIGFILKRFNHFIVYWYDLFCTNIEGYLWGQIKRNTNNFSRILIEALKTRFDYGGREKKRFKW